MFISFWEIGSFEKVKKSLTETALIVVTNSNYCLFWLGVQEALAIYVLYEARTSPFSRLIAELWRVKVRTYRG